MTAPRVDRSRLPVPGPVRPFVFPSVERSVLSMGSRIWTVRHTAIPTVTFMLLVRRGAADDPPGKDGLAAITVDMLDEGSGNRSSIEIHEALARMGAQLDSDIGPDASLLTITVLSRFTDDALMLLGDIVVRPSLTEADFTRVRQLRLHRLTQLKTMPGAVADRTFMRLLYGTHAYGHTPLGSERTLSSIGIDDVRTFHAAAIGPTEATLIAVGDCDHASISRVAEVAFGGWHGSPVGAPAEEAVRTTPSRLNVVPRPGAPQSELRIGHVALPRSTPDYHALTAANMVLGGQFVSRINLNLRERRGFTYGARTSFDFRRLSGPFSLQVSVHTAATAEAITESLGEIMAIRGSRPVSAEELALGVAALTRGYAKNFETAEQIARAVSQMALYDLPDDYFARFVPVMEGVTPEDVLRVSVTHLHPERLTTLIVGDLDAIGSTVGALNLGEPTILSADTF